MLSKNSNIVKIDFDLKKGLILKWNFNGQLGTCYYRHILIFDVNPQFQIKQFIKSYNHKIKLGDMITYSYVNQKQQFILSRWREKTPLTELEPHRLKPIISSLNYLIELLSFIDEKANDFAEPTIFSIITQRPNNELILLQKHLVYFVSQRNNYCANVFCRKQTSINVSTGVNLMDLSDFVEESGWNFLKLYWSQIALLKVKIIIECQNGSIFSQKHSEWQTVEFNKIQRQMRMPTINYVQDLIQFLHQDFSDEVNYLLNITLQYEQLCGQSYKATKKISIKTMNEKVYQRTIAGNDVQYGVEVSPGIYSTKNPFQSDGLVWFKRNQFDQSDM